MQIFLGVWRGRGVKNLGNHVEMWLQVPLRGNWAQGDVDLYEMG